MAENGEKPTPRGARLLPMELEPDICYAALSARDRRFDGIFYVGVSTTGIFCRPVCTARLPRRDRCTFYRHAAAAEAAGYRPCLRCRPELAPGTSRVDAVSRVARMAFDRIEAGELTDRSLTDLAADLGLSARQLRRVVEQTYGVTPIQLAQTRRLLLAKQLIADTRLSMADIAFAAGFSSVRRFNHLFRVRYGLQPSAMRRGRRVSAQPGIELRLGYRPPFDWSGLSGFLASRGAPAVEQLVDGEYRRTVRLDNRVGWLMARPAGGERHELLLHVSESLVPALTPLLASARQLFDLNADPAPIDAHLRDDPLLGPCVAAAPGLRIPGGLSGFEIALRAILGQQISVRAATTLYGRFAERFGTRIETPWPALQRTPPDAAAIADAPLQALIDLGLPTRRAQTIQAVALAVTTGQLRLDATADAQDTMDALLAMPGIGPWTVQYLAMRVLGQPDALPASDLGLMKAADCPTPKALAQRAEAWRPWRSYAAMHLWQSLTRTS